MQAGPRHGCASCVIAVVVACVYWFIDTRSTLWDRDEPRFARATVEMVESGNYLYPTFNGHLRPDKPILIYWLMSVPIRVLGPTSLACRFFAAIGIAITCVFTFLLGRRFLDVRAGLWSDGHPGLDAPGDRDRHGGHVRRHPVAVHGGGHGAVRTGDDRGGLGGTMWRSWGSPWAWDCWPRGRWRCCLFP